MKKLITLFTILLFSFSFAQFNPESGTKTNNTIKIESKTYPIYKTNKGTEYIYLTSQGKSFILVASKNSDNL